MYNKVVIYGHKLHSHTHSYIHEAFYNAFCNKGFETIWIDETDDLEKYDFSKSIFLTEGQVINKMPIRDDCKYLLHYVDKQKTQQLGIKQENILNFRFFENSATCHEKINDFTFYDSKKRELWMPWAATLFPSQIDRCSEKLFNEKEKNVNFIGSIWSVNEQYINEFRQSCIKNNKNFVWRRLVSNKEYYYHTVKSYATVDFRGKVHLDIGYLPCRIFKALSFGVIPGTNSKYVKEAFGEHVYYNPNLGEILEGTADFWKSKNKNEIRDAMNFIKNKHTYLNRIEDMLGVLDGV